MVSSQCTLRNADVFPVFEVGGEALDVAAFRQIIQFLIQRAAELVIQRIHVDAAANGAIALDPAGRRAQRLQIDRDQRFDAGALHFHDRPFAAFQHHVMHLPQRGGRRGHGINRGEDLADRAVEFALQRRADVVERFGGHFVLQAGQLVDDLFGQNVHAAGEELAELDHHAAQFDGHDAEAAGVIEVALQRRPIGPLAPAEIADEHIPPERGDEDAKPKEDDAIAALAELSGATSGHGSE